MFNFTCNEKIHIRITIWILLLTYKKVYNVQYWQGSVKWFWWDYNWYNRWKRHLFFFYWIYHSFIKFKNVHTYDLYDSFSCIYAKWIYVYVVCLDNGILFGFKKNEFLSHECGGALNVYLLQSEWSQSEKTT